MDIKIKIRVFSVGSAKLQFVKIIKDFLYIGLKEAKDIMDSITPGHPYMYEVSTTASKIEQFKLDMSKTDAIFDLDDVSRKRNRKLIGLGIYEKSDLVDELVEDDMYVIYKYSFETGGIGGNLDEVRDLLKKRYSSIPEEILKKELENGSNL